MLTFYLTMLDCETDKTDFEYIYKNFADDIYKRAYTILHDSFDAEDAMQETWQYVYENISFFHNMDDGRKRAYITGIAKNKALIILQKKRKEAMLLCDIDVVKEPDTESDSELFAICDNCSIEEIKNCVGLLGEIYRDVLLYYYFHELSIKQIADLMGIKETTVGTRLVRGREKLCQLLIRRGFYE